MLTGFVTIDGRSVGTIDANLIQDAPELEAYEPSTSLETEDSRPRLGHAHGFYPGQSKTSGDRHETRLGHAKGFYPKEGAKEKHKDVRLGHKQGFHPAANTAALVASKHDGSGAPSAILDQARHVALAGGPSAVQRYMAEQGYPKNGNWCGEFAASVVKGAGGTPPKDPAIASNWRNWGSPTNDPQPGDIAIRRGPRTGSTGSHVTIVEDANIEGNRFKGIGGNQGRFEKNFPASQYEFRHGTTSPSVTRTPDGKQVKGSWFDDASTATGLSAAINPGIALPTREGLGKMHEVTGPNGKTVLLPQIDIGPAKWTGRGIDISKAALNKLGYTTKDFPTDSSFTHKPAELEKKIDTSTEPM